MRFVPRIAIIGLLAASLLTIIVVRSAFAQTLTEDQLQHIRTNCSEMKSTLNQLHASDALLRVNRGQLYESMAAKLMDRFIGRLNANGADSTGLSVTTSSYRTALDGFRTDYKFYEEQLSSTIRIDCQSQPQAFHDALEIARTRRLKVHTDIVRLNQYIDDYQREVDIFTTNFLKKSGGNS